MVKNYGNFRLYDNQPCDIIYGSLYIKEVILPWDNSPRKIRVYLPEDYNLENRYPVIYMTDGQNMVDKYTTIFGAWDLDISIHERLMNNKCSFVLVGIDCCSEDEERTKEYISYSVKNTSKFPYFSDDVIHGRELMDYICDVLKPEIDNTFNTLADFDNTAFAGSSMGGLFTFDILSTKKDVFSFGGIFSPAFLLFNKKYLKENIDNRKLIVNNQKYVFFSGGVELDAEIMPGTIDIYNYLKKLGYDEEHTILYIDSLCKHNEYSWHKYFNIVFENWK